MSATEFCLPPVISHCIGLIYWLAHTGYAGNMARWQPWLFTVNC